jgi:4-hydroxy-tetrahydrodipicolinate synthase
MHGVLSVLCTPFKPGGEVDLPGFDRLVAHQLGWGVDGLVLFGLAGEGYTLTDAERRELVTHAVGRAGQVPVIVSTEHNSAPGAVARTREAVDLGAAAVMAYPPSFVKPDEASILSYYRALSECGVPVVIQDAPAWTGVALSVDLLARIASAAPHARFVKVEAPPMAPKATQLASLGLTTIGGFGAQHLLEDLSSGVAAIMPGCGMPGLYRDVWAAHRRHDDDAAWNLYGRALPALVFQMSSLDTFVSVQKLQLEQAGVLTSTKQRAPSVALTDAQQAWWHDLVRRGGLSHYVHAPQS